MISVRGDFHFPLAKKMSDCILRATDKALNHPGPYIKLIVITEVNVRFLVHEEITCNGKAPLLFYLKLINNSYL